MPQQEVNIHIFSAAIQTKCLKAGLTSKNTLPGCRIRLGFQQRMFDLENVQAETMSVKSTYTGNSAPSTAAQPDGLPGPSRKALARGLISKQLGGKQVDVDMQSPLTRPQPGHLLGAEVGEARHTPNVTPSNYTTRSSEPERQSQGAEATEDTVRNTGWRQSVEVVEVADETAITAIIIRCSTLRDDCRFQTEIGELSLSDS